jgi:hypothetical protein
MSKPCSKDHYKMSLIESRLESLKVSSTDDPFEYVFNKFKNAQFHVSTSSGWFTKYKFVIFYFEIPMSIYEKIGEETWFIPKKYSFMTEIEKYVQSKGYPECIIVPKTYVKDIVLCALSFNYPYNSYDDRHLLLDKLIQCSENKELSDIELKLPVIDYGKYYTYMFIIHKSQIDNMNLSNPEPVKDLIKKHFEKHEIQIDRVYLFPDSYNEYIRVLLEKKVD